MITARNETYTGADGITRPYSSARLQTFGKFDFTYGRIDARIKVPAGAGLWPAFWALGDDAYSAGDWPASGEIDVMELLDAQPQVVYGTIHGPIGASADGYQVQGTYRSSSSLADGYHVYSALWGPSSISFQVDGHTYRTVRTADLPAGASWPFRHPFFLVLNLAVGGSWGGPPTASTPWPARMLVDWVSVSRLAAAARPHGRWDRLHPPPPGRFQAPRASSVSMPNP